MLIRRELSYQHFPRQGEHCWGANQLRGRWNGWASSTIGRPTNLRRGRRNKWRWHFERDVNELPKAIDCGYLPCTTGNSEFIFIGAPPHKGSCAIDPQCDQSGLPDYFARKRIMSLLPHVSIPVLGRCDDTIGVRGPINACDQFVVLWLRC